MKKIVLFVSLLVCGLAFTLSSCSDEKKDPDVNPADVDLTAKMQVHGTTT